MPSIKEVLNESSARLRGVAQNPKKEALILMSHFLGYEIIWLLAHDDVAIDISKEFEDAINRREKSYPMEYILKRASFYSMEFYTDERVLIPRPETEILIDKIISACRGLKKVTIAEIGTGSGIISITLAKLLPFADIVATDISSDALDVAKINAEKHHVSQKIRFVNCSLLDDINEKIDIVVSNPPYIKIGEELDKNLSYEPDIALFGGERGDEILRKIIDESIRRDVNVLACEMGYDQKSMIANYIAKIGRKVEFYKDFAGLQRGFVVKSL